MPIWAPLITFLAAGTAAPAANSWGPQPCPPVDVLATQPCVEPLLTPKKAAALIKKQPSYWSINEERRTLTVIARLNDDGGEIRLCCAIQTRLQPIAGTKLAAVTLRIPQMEQALLDVALLSGPTFEPPQEIRGNLAPPAPPVVKIPESRILSRQFISRYLKANRDLTIYVPPYVPNARRLPVIYLADGEVARGYAEILEAAVAEGKARPAIIVGIHSAKGVAPGCRVAHCDRRNLEYIPDSKYRGGQDFRDYLSFVEKELVPYIDLNFRASSRREDRIVAGFSSGAVWAFSAAALLPEMFGKVLGMSSGSESTVGHARGIENARVYAGAGLFEPRFLRATQARIDLVERPGKGNKAKFQPIVSGHSSLMWDVLFRDGASWLLPPAQVRTASRSDSSPNASDARPASNGASFQPAALTTSRAVVPRQR